MRILAIKQVFFCTLTLIITSSCLHAQEAKVVVNQDPKFEQLLNEKRKSNVSITVNDRYKIQIFSGDSENAKKTLRGFKQEFTDVDGTIVFKTTQPELRPSNARFSANSDVFVIIVIPSSNFSM